MTHALGNILFIKPEDDRECSQCHKMAECRPYGRDGADLCYDCGMLPENRDIVLANLSKTLDNKDAILVVPK